MSHQPPRRKQSLYPMEWRLRAELLARRGYSPAEIRAHLLDEGKDVTQHRIAIWTEGIRCDADGTSRRVIKTGTAQ